MGPILARPSEFLGSRELCDLPTELLKLQDPVLPGTVLQALPFPAGDFLLRATETTIDDSQTFVEFHVDLRALESAEIIHLQETQVYANFSEQ